MTDRRSSHAFCFALASAAFALVLAACSRSSDTATRDSNSASAADEAAAHAAASVDREIELEVKGGPRAGRYTAKAEPGGEGDCNYGLEKVGGWSALYTATTEDAKQLTQLQLVVPDAKAAASGTNRFLLLVNFGPGGEDGHYQVLTENPERRLEGSGTAKIEDRGSTATLTFDAVTQDGVGLKGTIKCNNVHRVG